MDTPTTRLQAETEALISTTASQANNNKLKKAKHDDFLRAPLLAGLNRWFVALDASKPWLIYWILHSLDLLQEEISSDMKDKYEYFL